jgi:hypothetical protein
MTLGLTPEGKSMVELATIFAPGGRAASQGVEAGAMALGRAGEQYAERKVPEVMSRGGRPAQLLSDLAKGTISPATVFHGSPHKFTKFDSSKIGTGEGAQVYGHGLYLAENPAVAKDYQNSLSGYTVDGKRLPSDIGTVVGAFDGDVTKAIAAKKDQLNRWTESTSDKKHFIVKGLENEIKMLSELKGKKLESAGNFYQVDLPDEQIAKMLDYDKPLSEQSEFVRKAIQENELDYVPDRLTGGRLLEELHKGFAPDVAAKHLRDAGIPGIRYLDQGSRAVPNITNKRLANLYAKHGGNAEAAVDEMMRSVYNSPKQKEAMREQFLKELQNVKPKTSNFVVFPGMEDMLTIEKINESPMDLLLNNLQK